MTPCARKAFSCIDATRLHAPFPVSAQAQILIEVPQQEPSGIELAPLVSLLESELCGGIGRAFECMDIAQQEIANAKLEFPSKAMKIHDAFLMLQPTDILHTVPMAMYRGHCKELLRRIGAGGKIHEPTNAEIVCCVSEMSIRAPLQHDLVVVAIRAMEQCAPELAATLDMSSSESWNGAADYQLDQFVNRLQDALARQNKDNPRFKAVK